MDARIEFQDLLGSDVPILALAPMQDVTHLRFMRLISGYGNADVYFTEYFRVLPESRLDPQILASITKNPTGRDVLDYVQALYEAVSTPGIRESAPINNMKKYMNFIGLGVEPTGEFLHQIRRATTRADLFTLCREFLDHDESMPLEPFAIALNPTDVMAGATR